MSVHSESAAALFLKRWKNDADLQWAVQARRLLDALGRHVLRKHHEHSAPQGLWPRRSRRPARLGRLHGVWRDVMLLERRSEVVGV